MQETEAYDAGGFKINSHGPNYQLKLLMLVFYRSFKKYHKFKLATEMAAADKFDDIVFQYEDEDGQTKAVLIQCKHRVEASDNKLFKLKGVFRLENSFKSYLKIKYDTRFDKTFIQSLILYTNAGSNASLQDDERLIEVDPIEKIIEILQFPGFKNSINPKPTFYRINNIHYFAYTIQSDLNAGKITQEDVEEFKAKFILAINQPNEQELDEIIKDELGEEFSILDSELVVNNLYCYMHKWMSDQNGKFITKEVGEVFFKDLKEKIRQMEIEGVVFANSEKKMKFGRFFESTDDLEHKFASAKCSFLHVMSESPSLTIIKIVQSLENKANFIVLNLRTLLAFANRVKDTFFSRSEFRIYVECTSIDENIANEAKILLDELLKHARIENWKKGIVMITNKNDKLVEMLKNGLEFARIDDHNHYKDLTLRAKERILDYNVKFQGCDIKLRDIVHENYGNILDEEILNRIVEKDEIKIGKALETTKEFPCIYIDRKLEINMERIKKKHKDKTDEEFMEIAKTQSGNKICVIEGGPGIGKSTELIHKSFMEKHGNDTTFVLGINLIDYSNEFDEVKVFEIDALLKLLIASQKLQTIFETCILKYQLLVSGGITVFLDGFDEISPMYEKSVFSSIKVLVNETKVSKVWIATREHATDVLEKELEPAVYQLQPFDEKDRKAFLQQYWIHFLNVTHGLESIGLFVDKLLDSISASEIEELEELIGIPLQMRMIAEVFLDQCQAYWESKGQIKVELKNINVYELFKGFINRKFEIYLREKVKIEQDNPQKKMFITHELQSGKMELQKMAVRLIFPNDCAVFEKPTKEIEIQLLSMGIIQNTNDSSVFIQRRFAEYFAAEFIAEKLIRAIKNAESIQFLHVNYFQRDNYMIRYFFDHILAEDSEIHMAVIKNDLSSVKELIEGDSSLLLKKDIMGRIPLHLSCVYSTFRTIGYTLNFPVNNVLDFLICKDVETNNPTQILAQDILNYDPFVYTQISRNKKIALDFLKWNYTEYHFKEVINLNKIAMQLYRIRDKFSSKNYFSAIKISYEADRNHMLGNCQDESNFKAIKPYFYKHKEKTRVCKENDYKILKEALKSYFIDIVCLELTDSDYLEEMDDELRNLDLRQKWFSEAIQTKDYVFLLGITLACPRTAFKLWTNERREDVLQNSLNERGDMLQIFTMIKNLWEKPEFFSDNKLKNYLVLAVRKLLKSRGEKTPRQMNSIEYFRKLVMDDYIGFKIALKLFDDKDREQILCMINVLEHDVILEIKQVNPYKLFTLWQYLYEHSFCINYGDIGKIHKSMNTDVDCTIRYMKQCIKNCDIVGINVLLSYAIRYFCAENRYRVIKRKLHQSSLFEHMNYIERWDEYSSPHITYFLNSRAMKGNILSKIDETLDQYRHAKSRGYPLSITQHIISHIVWLNSSSVPSFIEKHFRGEFEQYNFMESLIQDVKHENINDLLSYFTFSNDEQRNAVLNANKSEIIKYLTKAKCECSDAERRATKKDSNIRPFMSEEYRSEVRNTPEYQISIAHASESRDPLLLKFTNIFVN